MLNNVNNDVYNSSEGYVTVAWLCTDINNKKKLNCSGWFGIVIYFTK